MLTGKRTGEIFPTMLARHIATLDHILKGRLTINIINSNLPGVIESPELRYKRCCETIEILKQAWTKESIDFEGEIYQVKLDTTDPVKPYQQNGGPLLYFGGILEGSKEVCAKYCDVYLMWPEPEESARSALGEMRYYNINTEASNGQQEQQMSLNNDFHKWLYDYKPSVTI